MSWNHMFRQPKCEGVALHFLKVKEEAADVPSHGEQVKSRYLPGCQFF